MFKYLQQYRFYIILFLFILIPIIAIDTSTRAPRDYRAYDRVVVAITSPFQRLITWGLDTGISFYQNYVFLWRIRQDNRALQEENRKLLSTIVSLREAAQENKRLRSLLSFKEQFQLEAVAARVIAKDVSTEFRAIRINRGESDGIKKDMAVITSEGVVGRILRTTSTTADVVTVLDLLSSIDAIVERSRARGIVEGMTDEVCQLKFALRTDDIQVGDLLLTGALGGIFPKGIPVGIVSKVTKKAYGITQNVEVRPAVEFSKLEEVLIVTKFQTSPVHVAYEPAPARVGP